MELGQEPDEHASFREKPCGARMEAGRTGESLVQRRVDLYVPRLKYTKDDGTWLGFFNHRVPRLK